MRKAATSPGIAGNDLNRCDAPALQHKIRADCKRTAVFFADSRLRDVEMGGGGWKRGAWDSKKERFVQKKSFWFAKKINFFSSCTQRKTFFQRITTPTSHYTKANEQLQISSAKPYCKLAVQ